MPPSSATPAKQNMSGKNQSLADLPPLATAPAADKQALFHKKILLCKKVYDFRDTKADVKEKEAKRQALLEMVDYASSRDNVFTEAVLPDFMDMVAANLFRTLPHRERNAPEIAEEEEPMLEESWPHLQIVYELLLRFVVSREVDAKIAKKYITKQHLVKLIGLFDSEDPREREYLKTILHRIYGKSMALRAFIRRTINNSFFTFVYESESFNGIGELLEILGSIINGFALPLKQEHLTFLQQALIPLHKVACVANYHSQLAYCVTQFVEKDPTTAEMVILGLLKYWPVTSSTKEVLFINELEELLDLTQPAEFEKLIKPLFTHISKAMCSEHFQVAQRALYLWNNEYIVSLVAQKRHIILPMLFAPLYKNCETHWHNNVQTLTYNVLKLFMEMDTQLFDQCSAAYQEKEGGGASEEVVKERMKQWEMLEQNQHQEAPKGMVGSGDNKSRMLD